MASYQHAHHERHSSNAIACTKVLERLYICFNGCERFQAQNTVTAKDIHGDLQQRRVSLISIYKSESDSSIVASILSTVPVIYVL